MNRREEGASTRKIRSDKKIHVNPSLDQDTHHKLKRLAVACDITKTSLAEDIIRIAVNTPSFVKYLQDKYQADEFRVIPVNHNGKLVY